MIKEHGNVRKRTKRVSADCRTKRVYRDEVRTSKRYTLFLMSNLEGLRVFIHFFVKQPIHQVDGGML